jgi:hypothetical protein
MVSTYGGKGIDCMLNKIFIEKLFKSILNIIKGIWACSLVLLESPQGV